MQSFLLKKIKIIITFCIIIISVFIPNISSQDLQESPNVINFENTTILGSIGNSSIKSFESNQITISKNYLMWEYFTNHKFIVDPFGFYNTFIHQLNSYGIDSSKLNNIETVNKIKSLDLINNPEWQWAINAGGNDWDNVNDLDIDNFNNLYITGDFISNALFGSINLNSNSYGDIFVAKLDEYGNWLWVKNAGGNYYEDSLGISVDSYGNCYITGRYNDTIYFGDIEIECEGEMDLFVAKLDTNGNWQWAISAGGKGYDFSLDIGPLIVGLFGGLLPFPIAYKYPNE